MSWNTLANNQWITFRDAVESGYTQLQPVVSLNKFLTKAEALRLFRIDPSYLLNKADNQYITKLGFINNPYPTSSTVNWQYEVMETGSGGNYFRVYQNGTLIIDGSTSSISGSFTISDGDHIEIYSRTANGGPGANHAEIFVSGNLNLLHFDATNNYNTEIFYDFIWTSNMQSVEIGSTIMATTPITIYYNREYSVTAYRDNCPGGTTGSLVTTTVPYGKYTSQNSQYEADRRAIGEVTAIAQLRANLLGTCPIQTTGTVNWSYTDNLESGMTTNQVFSIIRLSDSMGFADIVGGGGSYSGTFTLNDGDEIEVSASLTSLPYTSHVQIAFIGSASGTTIQSLSRTLVNVDNDVVWTNFTYHTSYGTVTIIVNKTFDL